MANNLKMKNKFRMLDEEREMREKLEKRVKSLESRLAEQMRNEANLIENDKEKYGTWITKTILSLDGQILFRANFKEFIFHIKELFFLI